MLLINPTCVSCATFLSCRETRFSFFTQLLISSQMLWKIGLQYVLCPFSWHHYKISQIVATFDFLDLRHYLIQSWCIFTWMPSLASLQLYHLKWCQWQGGTLWSRCSRSRPCRRSWRCGRRSPWHSRLGNTGCRSWQRRVEWACRWGSPRWTPCTTPATTTAIWEINNQGTGTWMVSSSYLVLAFKNITSSLVSLPALEPPCPILPRSFKDNQLKLLFTVVSVSAKSFSHEKDATNSGQIELHQWGQDKTFLFQWEQKHCIALVDIYGDNYHVMTIRLQCIEKGGDMGFWISGLLNWKTIELIGLWSGDLVN